MKVFISWAETGSRSQRFAEILANWIYTLFQGKVTCFVSTSDIASGTTWMDKLFQAVDESVAGIVIVTPESLKSQWLLFEAGALAKKVGWNNQRLCPLLLEIGPADIKDPLAAFQFEVLDSTAEDKSKSAISKVVKMLTTCLAEEGEIDETNLFKLYEMVWPSLWVGYSRICSESPSAAPAPDPISPNELYLEVRSALRQIVEAISENKNTPEEVVFDCPNCKLPNTVPIRRRGGETVRVFCARCGLPFNAHIDSQGVPFTRPYPVVHNHPRPSPAGPIADSLAMVTCCYCGRETRAELKNHPGATGSANCEYCYKKINVHRDSFGNIFSRPGLPSMQHPQFFAERSYSTPEDFLRATQLWIEPTLLSNLIHLAGHALADPQTERTPNGVKVAIAKMGSSEGGSYLPVNPINCFVKCLMLGGAFLFAPGEPPTFRAPFVNSPTADEMIRAVFRALVGRLRTKFALGEGDAARLGEKLKVSDIQNGPAILLEVLREPAGDKSPSAVEAIPVEECIANAPKDEKEIDTTPEPA